MKRSTLLPIVTAAILSACGGQAKKTEAPAPTADRIIAADPVTDAVKPAYPIYTLQKGESLRAFAERLLPDSCELEGNPIGATWNDRYIMVSAHRQFDPDTTYQAYGHYYFLTATLYIETEGDRYRKLFIDSYGPEGGNAFLESFFFANADGDPEKELLTIVSWRHKHYDVEGKSYKTYVYDDKLPPTETVLTALKKISEQLDGGCDCNWRDGKVEKAKYKTAADVKKRLKEMGF